MLFFICLDMANEVYIHLKLLDRSQHIQQVYFLQQQVYFHVNFNLQLTKLVPEKKRIQLRLFATESPKTDHESVKSTLR